jgi:hypothetical protein
MKVFLGGTCNGSTWRDDLIPFLVEHGIDYHDPRVEDWDEECQALEKIARREADWTIYFITKEMTGGYSIAEAVDDLYQKSGSVVFGFDAEGFSNSQIHSLTAVKKLIQERSGFVCKEDSLSGLKDRLLDIKNGVNDFF